MANKKYIGVEVLGVLTIPPPPSSPLPPIGKVFKAFAHFGDATVGKDISVGAVTDFWLTFPLGIPAAAKTWFESEGFSGRIAQLRDGVTQLATIQFINSPAVWDLKPGSGGTLATEPDADIWMLIEIHYNSTTGVMEFYRDGTLLGTHTGTIGTPTNIRIGLNNEPEGPDAILYFAWVRLSTARTTGVLFFDDFEDGTLDAWDSSNGLVSVIDNPF